MKNKEDSAHSEKIMEISLPVFLDQMTKDHSIYKYQILRQVICDVDVAVHSFVNFVPSVSDTAKARTGEAKKGWTRFDSG